MKNTLLLLSALIVAPVWAEDASVVPSTLETSVQAAPDNKGKCVQMAFLSKNFSAKTAPVAAGNSSEPGCPTGCVFMACPPPSGPAQCCNTSTFQPCY